MSKPVPPQKRVQRFYGHVFFNPSVDTYINTFPYIRELDPYFVSGNTPDNPNYIETIIWHINGACYDQITGPAGEMDHWAFFDHEFRFAFIDRIPQGPWFGLALSNPNGQEQSRGRMFFPCPRCVLNNKTKYAVHAEIVPLTIQIYNSDAVDSTLSHSTNATFTTSDEDYISNGNYTEGNHGGNHSTQSGNQTSTGDYSTSEPEIHNTPNNSTEITNHNPGGVVNVVGTLGEIMSQFHFSDAGSGESK